MKLRGGRLFARPAGAESYAGFEDNMSIEILHCNCMDYMATLPDKAFDLAIVDPPYGIGAGGIAFKNGSSKSEKP